MTAGRIIPAALISILIMGCEEKIDLSLKSEDTGLLVVEGVLTNEKTNHAIILSHPHDTLNAKPAPVTGAIINVTEGNNSYKVTESPAESGHYLTEPMQAVFGKTYTLNIQYQGKQYFAQDSSVPVEPLQALQYKKASDPQFYSLTLNNSGSGANYIGHDITWKGTGFCNSSAACEGKIVFYDLKTIDVNEIYKPDKEEFVFPLNSIIVRKKYSISDAYKAFLRSVLSETEWRGGVFDVQRENAPTNLSKGAIGFFAVSTVVSDTTVIVEKP